MRTLAVVPLGTGVANEISAMFDDVVHWTADAKYDAILLEGGADIHPSLYGEQNTHSHVGDVPSTRDEIEVLAFNDAVSKGALIIGICRGAQLACALAGGKLVQDVHGHHGDHMVETKDGELFAVSSVHHQQMYPWNVEHELLAWSQESLSPHYHGSGIDLSEHKVEPEAVYFPKVNALAFQFHPEWWASEGEISFTLKHIKEKLDGQRV